MSRATQRVQEAARDASSGDDLVREVEMVVDKNGMIVPPPLDSPLDEQTLDERASTQMGEGWEPRRRDAN